MADDRDVMALDLAKGRVLGELQSAVLSRPVFGLADGDGFVYGVDDTDAGGLVVAVGHGELTEVGTFAIESAVDNAVWRGPLVFRRAPSGLEVATLE